MCSYTVRNMNLNFGGEFWALDIDVVVTSVSCYKEIKRNSMSIIVCPLRYVTMILPL